MAIESTNIGNIEHATIYSDWHLRPEDMLRVAGTVLHNERWSGMSYPNLPLNDIFNPPENSGSIVIGAGDMFHINPLLPFQREIASDALLYLTDAMYKKRVTGKQLKIIPGNHTRLEYFPPDALSYLTEEGIVEPSGKISFTSGGEDFLVIHGHEAQPGFNNIPFTGNARIARAMDKLLDKYRQLYNNGDNSRQYPFPPWLRNLLNVPQKNWQRKNLPTGTKLISGHTHVPEITPDYLNSGFLDTFFGYLSFGKVDNGEMQSLMKEV